MSDYIRRQDAVEKCGEWYVEEGPEEGFIGTVSQMLDMFSPAAVLPYTIAPDGTLTVTVTKGTEVSRVLVQEDGTQWGGLFYAD